MAVASSGRSGDGRGAVRALALNAVSRNVANLLTLARLVSVVPIVLLVDAHRFPAAFYLFLAAALSDVLDGYVAKRFNGCSPVGAVLDPVADKTLVIALFAALHLVGAVPGWFLGLIVVRDLLIVGGALSLRGRVRGFRIEPLLIGKLCTFVQLLFAGFVLGQLAGIADVAAFLQPLLLLAVVVTVASAAAYLASTVRLLTATGQPG